MDITILAVTLATLALALIVVAAILAVLLFKVRTTANLGETERLCLANELEVQREKAETKEESSAQRLVDLAAANRTLLEEKDKACAAALAEKDRACAAALAEKDRACAAALAEKDRACAAAIEAQRQASDQIVREKAEALKRKDDECQKALKDKNDEISRFIQEKEKSFAQVVAGLKESFGNLAAIKIKEQQTGLTDYNKTQMEGLVKPLREQLQRLQELTQSAQNSNDALGKQIGGHVDAIGKIADTLNGVATALSSNTRFQGQKGEEILAEKLRQAGLEEGVNFFLQKGSDQDRPDAQVCDTENRWLIIDSKVSLTAYMEYMAATDETVKADLLAKHVASVQKKIDELACRKYPVVFAREHADRNYLPITAMFMPYEAPLMVALKEKPSLWQFALQNNVILITPLTLLAYLRLVYLAWQHEKEARNQQAIVDTARELLKRANDFLITFEELGKSLDSMKKVYDRASAVLVPAPHAQTIANSAVKLIDLHVKLEGKKGKPVKKAQCLKELDEMVEEEAQGEE